MNVNYLYFCFSFIITLLVFILVVKCLCNSEHFGQKERVLNIIIPYRNRKEDLKMFEDRIPKILDELNINYKFWLIEQSEDNKKFNKGKLINVGYLESQNSQKTTIIVFMT